MKIFIILCLATFLYANVKKEIYNFYEKKNYIASCNVGYKDFDKFKNNEKFVSLYAFACLKSDFIDRLAIPITKLKYSKESRTNASFFSTILMQKKLLYRSMVDGYDISSLNLPSTEYILSKVFDSYVRLKSYNNKKVYIFEDDKDKKIKYKLSLVKTNKIYKIVIDEFYDNKFVKKHIYW